MDRSKWLGAPFVLGVIAMPFDAVPGSGALGELAHEASFYCFGPALLYAAVLVIGGRLAGTTATVPGARWIGRGAAALLACIALSALANAGTIGAAQFHDRGGTPKLLTSAGVIAYGFALAWLAAGCAGSRVYPRLVVPIAIGACLCAGYSLFEQASVMGLHLAPFDTLERLVHSGADQPDVLWDGSLNRKMLEGWDKRLRSVSFEPPAFGNFTGLVWPWLLCGVLMTRGRLRAVHAAILATFTVLIISAQARTGWLLLASNVATFAALRAVYLPTSGKPRPRAGAAALAAGALAALAGVTYYALSFDHLVDAVVRGDSVSDLSRLAYQVTAFRMFLANPVLGVGLGQFAFGAADFMPSWGFLSSEIRPSLVFPGAPWPNTYSLYARLAAELGLVGLMTWLAIWITTALAVRHAGIALARTEGTVPPACYALLMTIVAILVSSVTTDTFRAPMIWIALGAAARFIADARAVEHTRSVLPATKQTLNFTDGVPWLFLPMGVPDNILAYRNHPRVEPIGDYCYMGSMLPERRIDTMIASFLQRYGAARTLWLYGKADPALQAAFRGHPNIVFPGMIAHETLFATLSGFAACVCYFPNHYPHVLQTPTKLLEYAALGLRIIANEHPQ